MRVAVVGLGPGGATVACLLADAGHDVTVLERAEEPRAVGAGIWLQEMGQQVLDRLGVLDALRAVSRPVERVEIVTVGGRTLVDLKYDALPGSTPALGVARGDLFTLLLAEVHRRGIRRGRQGGCRPGRRQRPRHEPPARHRHVAGPRRRVDVGPCPADRARPRDRTGDLRRGQGRARAGGTRGRLG